MTTDLRYVISVSNKFITYDVSTSDLVREVHPGVKGLMLDVIISQDNRFAAAYTNNSQTILLNTMVSEYITIDNPLGEDQTVQGLLLYDNKLIIYGQYTWCVFSTSGKLMETKEVTSKGSFPILSLMLMTVSSVSDLTNVLTSDLKSNPDSKELHLDYFIIRWSGDMSNSSIILETRKNVFACTLDCHGGIVLNEKKDKVWTCPDEGSNNVALFTFKNGKWIRGKDYYKNTFELIQLALSSDETYLVGAFKDGFQLWKTTTKNPEGSEITTLKLPNNVRNVSVKMNKTNECVLLKNNNYAIAGVRKVYQMYKEKFKAF